MVFLIESSHPGGSDEDAREPIPAATGGELTMKGFSPTVIGASAILAAALWTANGAFAETAATASDAAAAGSTEAEAEDEERNSVEIFLGASVKDDGGAEAGFSLGASYDYRWFVYLSTGVIVELTTGGLRDGVFVGSFTAHPWRGLKLFAAPGLEFGSDEGTQFLMRLGTSYDFDTPWFGIGPEFAVDLVKAKPTFVVGVAVGFEF